MTKTVAFILVLLCCMFFVFGDEIPLGSVTVDANQDIPGASLTLDTAYSISAFVLRYKYGSLTALATKFTSKWGSSPGPHIQMGVRDSTKSFRSPNGPEVIFHTTEFGRTYTTKGAKAEDNEILIPIGVNQNFAKGETITFFPLWKEAGQPNFPNALGRVHFEVVIITPEACTNLTCLARSKPIFSVSQNVEDKSKIDLSIMTPHYAGELEGRVGHVTEENKVTYFGKQWLQLTENGVTIYSKTVSFDDLSKDLRCKRLQTNGNIQHYCFSAFEVLWTTEQGTVVEALSFVFPFELSWATESKTFTYATAVVEEDTKQVFASTAEFELQLFEDVTFETPKPNFKFFSSLAFVRAKLRDGDDFKGLVNNIRLHSIKRRDPISNVATRDQTSTSTIIKQDDDYLDFATDVSGCETVCQFDIQIRFGLKEESKRIGRSAEETTYQKTFTLRIGDDAQELSSNASIVAISGSVIAVIIMSIFYQ